ncbi:hypothetical protein HanHA300_Chr04g0117441 [Helianthus annuus]|nr:hypothetical protein HanHA300_Chr04g0117441 [Helianthus annuus]KAJ0755949.1 hypothetical protein HanLR1_Chr04g0121611 [Helianthus annuus]
MTRKSKPATLFSDCNQITIQYSRINYSHRTKQVRKLINLICHLHHTRDPKQDTTI